MQVSHPQCPESLHNRLPPAIGKNQVELRQETTQRIVRVLRQAVEGGRGIDVPVDDAGPRPPQVEDARFQQTVEHPDAACLDDDVGAACRLQTAIDAGLIGRINHHPRPGRIGQITMALAVEGVRFIEGDVDTRARPEPG